METFGKIMFTPAVEQAQRTEGSYETYARVSARDAPEGLGAEETAFLTTRTSIYMATVSETGWPYVEHRGGPAGFIKVLDPRTIAFADYRGNRQLVSAGNLSVTDRVSVFAMDYPRQARLKLLGHGSMKSAEAEPELAAELETEGQGRVERVMVITVAAFDWNCPKFITPRFDATEMTTLVGPEIERLEARIAELEAECASLRANKERDQT